MKSQSLFVELDESTRIQIEKLRSDNAQTVKDMQRKFDIALKKKDDQLHEAMQEIANLKNHISILRTDALEKKAAEEMKLNEKEKELSKLQNQFHDAIVHE